MKKSILVLSIGLFLVSCVNKPTSSISASSISSEISSSEYIFSEEINSSSSSLSSTEQSINSSEHSFEVSSNEVSSSQSSVSSSEEIIEEKEVLDYGYHPMSEPSINKQLVTFNPMGDLKNVWDYYRGDKVVVAVIDSGFDYDHPEFVDINGKSRVSEKSAYIYIDSSKKVKVEVGRNKVDITDGDSHGTMCAGLLGSSVNKVGITGIAPNVELMLIKIDKHALSMAEAFKYAADNGARVISTSLGQYPNSNGEQYGDIHFEKGLDLATVFNTNINYAYSKGVSIVAATGNSRETRLSYPAGCDNVIGAGGLNAGSTTQIWDNGYEGSNYNGSKVYVDVFAPSDGIYAPGYDASNNKPTYWGDAKGTSFAAPLIAGAIALYYQKYPNATNKDVENALKSACINISSYNGNKNMGLGRLDVGKLLNINEDVVKRNLTSTTTVFQKATKLKIVDEEGWNFRTLHLYNVVFEEGYGYKELENYFEDVYGKRVMTSSYKVEGSTKCYAYTDEGFVGDYYLNIGNTVDGKPTNYEYIFPWWVKEACYQIVNNNHWFPEDGGNRFTYSDGYGKEITSYFWYDSDTSFDVTQVVGNSYSTNMKANTISRVVGNKTYNDILSVYDYYEVPSLKVDSSNSVSKWYSDSNYQYPYIRTNFTQSSVIYGK